MRIICFIFFTIVLFGISASNEDRYDGTIDTKVVEYEDNDSLEAKRPNGKKPPKGIRNFVGTNLFGEDGYRKKCFSAEDIALLAARRDFESLIPKDLPNCLLDDELARLLMRYFYGASQVIEKMSGGHSQMFAQRAFHDTLGGYLKYYMIPISRYSFYAGLVKLRTVENIIQLYGQCKEALNTNGNSWRAPIAAFTDLDIQIEPVKIIIRNQEEDTSCIQLDLLDERTTEDDNIIVALPRLDPQEGGLLGNIWLPFKRKRTFNLQSDMSAFVLLRYFELTTRCYNFQGICQDTFNKKFKEWILENLEVHFGDDVLYPGLGAVLRIAESLRRKNKSIVTVVPRSNEQRQKTSSLKPLEKHSDHWLEGVFGVDKSPALLGDYLEDTYIQKEQECRMKYIYIAIGVAVILLIIVFLAIALSLFRKFRGKPGWFGKKPRDDEEVLLYSKSPSSHKPKSTTPKKKENSPPKTTACFGLCTKKDSPAIIETSSMDSDSGREAEKKVKTELPTPVKSKRTKTVTVDERKRFSISKKNKQRNVAEEGNRTNAKSLIPEDLPGCLLDDEIAGILMRYFYGVNQVIEKIAGGHSKIFAQKAFYDTLGGYLQCYMVPISKYSFYAGLVKLRTVKNIRQLYTQCKEILNTNGNSWRAPIADFTDLDIQIEPLRIIIGNQKEDTSCDELDLLDERSIEDGNMIVSLPRLDSQERGLLGNIWLPFKRKRSFNLQSDMSAFVLLRYFELTTRCYNFQGIRQDTFNKQFKEWILENLEVHFGDDVLYPGLGAILRIVETLRRRNATALVVSKSTEKRHKTSNYKVLEHKAKQLEKHSDDWLQSVFATNSKDDLKEISVDTLRSWYVYIAIAVAVLLLIFVIAWAFLLKRRRKRSPRPSSSADDETVLLGPESSSIASFHKPTKRVKSLKSNRGSTSSSSSPPQPPKCFALCTKKNHDYRELVSSMDSDSEGDSKTLAKEPVEHPKATQLGAVYEKKRVTISRKARKKDDDLPGPSPKGGILKK